MDNKTNKPTYDELAAENAGLKVAAIFLADEATEIYKRWNLTQQPDGDIVDAQTIHELMCACHETPATDAYLSQLRNEARTEIAVMMEGHAARYDALAKQTEDFGVDNRYRFTAAMFRGVAKELREGKASPQSSAIEFPKNNSSSNGWTIDPRFLSRVSDRAEAVYGYRPGLEEAEAALLAGLDLLREGKAGEVQS